MSAEALDAAAAERSWILPVAVVASLVALLSAAILSTMVIRAGRDWHALPVLDGPSSLAGISIVLWLVATLLGVGLGVVALIIGGKRRRLAIVAIGSAPFRSRSSQRPLPATASGCWRPIIRPTTN